MCVCGGEECVCVSVYVWGCVCVSVCVCGGEECVGVGGGDNLNSLQSNQYQN